MAEQKTRYTTEPLILRHESGQLILPNEIAAEVRNFELTSEGTLLSTRGPAPYVPGRDALSENAFSYDGKIRGVFHALLMRGSRDVLIIQDGDEIKVHQGWETGTTSAWKTLIGSGATAQYRADIPSTNQPQFPCQFEATPRGIVIVPQPYQRAYFYDGEVVLPLGYSARPAPPTGYGPETKGTAAPGHNADRKGPCEAGYSIDRAFSGKAGIHQDFGYGRLGTLGFGDNVADGILLPGRWQAAIQWIDYFGNYSAQSERSNEITFELQRVNDYGGGGTATTIGLAEAPKDLAKHIAWGNIDRGRDGTLGRLLLRTHDMVNSGTTQLYAVPGNVGSGGDMSAFATIPDNHTRQFPDNIPDAWLVGKSFDCIPVPAFKLCRAAFGRLWIGNTEGDPGLLLYSYPGKYGTFEVGSRMHPDPNGLEITGLWNTPSGLLATTQSSVFIITPSDDGLRFRTATLSTTAGCIAPSSFGTMPDGAVIWLGKEGFYRFDGKSLHLISQSIHSTIKTINWGLALGSCAAIDPVTGEYRCWVPQDGSDIPDLCLIWDGTGWRRRGGERYRSVCATRDYRKYVLGGGLIRSQVATSASEGVWVQDHEVENFTPQEKEHRIETSWISWGRSRERKSVKTIYLALRETKNSAATIRVYRDWREGSTPIYTDTTSATLVLEEDSPSIWGTAKWDDKEAEYHPRRPYWKRVDIEIPSCEVYKIVITTQDRLEFIGLSIDEEPKLGGFGSRIG